LTQDDMTDVFLTSWMCIVWNSYDMCASNWDRPGAKMKQGDGWDQRKWLTSNCMYIKKWSDGIGIRALGCST